MSHHAVQDKSYPRDWLVRGRLRVELKWSDGRPCNPDVPDSESLQHGVDPTSACLSPLDPPQWKGFHSCVTEFTHLLTAQMGLTQPLGVGGCLETCMGRPCGVRGSGERCLGWSNLDQVDNNDNNVKTLLFNLDQVDNNDNTLGGAWLSSLQCINLTPTIFVNWVLTVMACGDKRVPPLSPQDIL